MNQSNGTREESRILFDALVLSLDRDLKAIKESRQDIESLNSIPGVIDNYYYLIANLYQILNELDKVHSQSLDELLTLSLPISFEVKQLDYSEPLGIDDEPFLDDLIYYITDSIDSEN